MASTSQTNSVWSLSRVLIIGAVAVLIVTGLVVMTAGLMQREAIAQPDEPVDALASSDDPCVTCHREETPGIVSQYAFSTMAAAGVTCRDCHKIRQDYPATIAHEGTWVLNSSTPGRCEPCHETETGEIEASRHGLPAYVAFAGSLDLTEDQLNSYRAIPEGTFAPAKERSQLYELEGPAITRFACEGCHNIGRPRADGSVGHCESCHLRHAFSLEQARKPETCNACHIGPDHPQWEIYQESAHGITYMTGGDDWHWQAEPGTLTPVDMPAATCATCHMSGFGATETTHDVGDRLAWYLFAPVSTRRPNWESNLKRMQKVCIACHNHVFIEDFYTAADEATMAVNAWVTSSDEIIAPAREQGKLMEAPFDQPIDFVHFELWHHWGRTAKFGAWIQEPDYVQWHGAYEILSDLAELRPLVDRPVESVL